METNGDQAELFGLIWRPHFQSHRLRVHDIIRIEGKLARVIRVTDCAAVVLMNRPVREFKTRFDKPVRFQPPPIMFRISANSAVEILNRSDRKPSKRKPR